MITAVEGSLRPPRATWEQLAPLVALVSVLAVIAVGAAAYVMLSGDGSAPRSPAIEGSWVLFDGIGSESMVFDGEGRATSMPASPPYVIGTGEIDGDRLTIQVEDIGSASGEYSTWYTGSRVARDEVARYLPSGLDASLVEAVYLGQFVRSDMPEFVIPVVAIKLLAPAP